MGIGISFLIGLLLAMNRHYSLVHLPQLQKISAEDLLIASFNMLFLNLIVVVLIHKTQKSFEESIWQRSSLYQELQKELSDSECLNRRLAESEDHYKTLFFASPLPKMIVDAGSQQLLQVNQAALNSYGFSEQELLSMKLPEITAPAEHAASPGGALLNRSSRVRKKDGELSFVELSSREILFKGRPALLVIAADMTEKVNHLTAIKRQNEHLREIAFMQAHVIRSPLTKIMSLTELLAAEQGSHENEVLASHLQESALELDRAVREIIGRSQQVLRESSEDDLTTRNES